MARREWIYLLVIVFIGVFFWSLGLRGEFVHADEARYALNGALIRDLLIDRPFGGVEEYVFAYYARYPALSLPYHPPLLPAAEALFYLLFGVGLVVIEEYRLQEGRPQWEDGKVGAYAALRELLKDASLFRPVARLPILSRGSLRGSEIAIYQFAEGGTGKARKVRINIPTMDRTIEADLFP